MSETGTIESTTPRAPSTPGAGVSYDPVPDLAAELGLPRAGVSAVVRLLAEGATVPFIARYRKEATGDLDEVQIRAIEERRTYLVELEERRAAVLAEIGKQGKLTSVLEAKVRAARTKAELEDLYLPYKPKRRTRATIAKERGLEPLGELLLSQPDGGDPAAEAARFVDPAKEVPDVAAALAGARDICAERLAESAEARKLVRETMATEGTLRVTKAKELEGKATKFDTYADFAEPVKDMPSHRFLAIRRGEAENVLRAAIEVDVPALQTRLAGQAGVKKGSPWAGELEKAVADAYKRLLATTVEVDVRVELKMAADRAAVGVFAQNLRELLLAAPFGAKAVLGIDPGQRTGCKCAVVDDTGKVLAHETVYLVQGDGALERARQTLRDLVRKHPVRAVAVGNGTHGRETEAFARELLAAEGLKDVLCVPVSESGASVYSASDVAREEFPDLDLTVRGAISIARRLQDPLAELVKVDPKSIGVGQYQHDVQGALLSKKLDEVVESCVNAVGVELNTASWPLLSRVAGIGPSLAKRIVAFRDQRGRFKARKELLEVPGLGPKTFEQAAGFLRIHGADHPLDASAVHPERYELVERIAADLGVPVTKLVGDASLVARIDPKKYTSHEGGAAAVGELTMRDILAELAKPGRDPRATFEPPKFRDDVREMSDLKPGMQLEGVVTNVTAFGAFVDVGVHQDGLVHVSQLADRFVKTPSDVVKVGDRVQVRVVEVDLERKRIALTCRTGEPAQASRGGAPQRPGPGGPASRPGERRPPVRDDRRGGGARPASGEKFSYNPFASLARK
jgi:uncharacterized protein